GLTVQDVQDWPAVLEAVTAEDIKAVAAEVLDPKRSVTMWVAASEGELK
ncbi:MAG: insulinase family protein, partial [Marivivens sp.]|nr:insulinase family protein [Marivivens sp.]